MDLSKTHTGKLYLPTVCLTGKLTLPQFPQCTSQDESPLLPTRPSCNTLLIQPEGFFADSASPTPNGTGCCRQRGLVDEASSASSSQGEQTTAPGSHPHPYRWGALAKLDNILVLKKCAFERLATPCCRVIQIE